LSRLSAKERLKELQKNDDLELAAVNAYDVAPTRIPELNDLLPGGYVKGKVNLVYGAPSVGKTTSSIETIADDMAKDKEHVCLLIPSERGDDMIYYQDKGLDISRTIIMKKQKYILEEVLDDMDKYLTDDLVDSILIDSWDGLIGFKELYTPDGKKKEATRDTVAVKAAGGSKMIKRVKGLIADRNVLCIVIAQVRTQGLGSYIVTEGFSGGNALKHFTDVEVGLMLKGMFKEKVEGRDVNVGQKVKIILKKSKVNKNAHKSAETLYRFDGTWDQVEGIWNLALNRGIITKRGGWYTYPGFPKNKKGEGMLQGESTAKDFFQDDTNRLNLQKVVDYIQDHPQKTDDDMKKAIKNLVPQVDAVDSSLHESKGDTSEPEKEEEY